VGRCLKGERGANVAPRRGRPCLATAVVMRATHASSIHVADRSEGVGQVSADRMRGPRVPEAVRIESIQHSGHGAAAAQSNSVVGEFFLFLVMGMSGWWTVNALFWAEIPLEVAKTPEKKAISSILNLACQAGNVVPFLYKAVFSKEQQRRILPYSIIACQLTAVVVAVVAACFWEETTHNHSVVLIACTVMAGAVGTLSNVSGRSVLVLLPRCRTGRLGLRGVVNTLRR
jgi:hypothetical protein